MHIIKTNKAVPYTAEEMFALVNDVAAYSEFLSWCTESTVHSQNTDELKATLGLAVSGFTQSITTHNFMQPHKMIEMRLVEGPVKHLQGFWHFEDHSTPDNPFCNIVFEMEFEFSNRFLRMMLEPFFNKVSDTIIDAFSTRAETLYRKA